MLSLFLVAYISLIQDREGRLLELKDRSFDMGFTRILAISTCLDLTSAYFDNLSKTCWWSPNDIEDPPEHDGEEECGTFFALSMRAAQADSSISVLTGAARIRQVRTVS